MTSDDSGGFNGFGYAVVTATALGLALLVLGGSAYSVYAVSLFFVAAFCAAWAMRRTRRETERDRPNRVRGDAEDEARKRREKEAEKAAYSGGGGDL